MSRSSLQVLLAVFAAICVASTSALNPAQVEMLQTLYKQTGGPNWKVQTGWMMPTKSWTDPCKMGLHGFKCTNKGVPESLDLSENNLKGTIPDGFFGVFPTITNVKFNGNKGLTGGLPVPGPESLVAFLYLQNCGFSGAIPDAIFTPQIKVLMVNFNSLSGGIPKAVGNATQLQDIYVGNNGGMGGAVPDEICNCHNLGVFDIQSSSFTSIPKCFGTDTPNLQVMNFFQNQLTGSIPDSWCQTPKLMVFQIQLNSGMTGSIPDCVTNWQNLETLAIENTGVGGTIPDAVFELRSMTHLTLSLSKFKGPIPDLFDNLPELVSVTFNGNAQDLAAGQPVLSGKFPQSLFRKSSMVSITIGYTTINDTVPSLSSLRNLQVLSLANNAEIDVTFPTELVQDIWLEPSRSQIPRELHLQNTPLAGTIPHLNPPYPVDIAKAGAAITLFNTKLTGYIPNSTLAWIPKPSQNEMLFKGCSHLLAPVESWMLPLTGDFAGAKFNLIDVTPKVFSMDGGDEMVLSGESLFGMPSGLLHCGFCVNTDYTKCTSANTSHTVFTEASFDSTSGTIRCDSPSVKETFDIKVDLYYRGAAYGPATQTFKLTDAPVSVTFYNPRPASAAVSPASGRREGCSRLTIHGTGFKNAPNATVVFSTFGFPDIIGDLTEVVSNTVVTTLLPFADHADHTAQYNQTLGRNMTVRVYPNGIPDGSGVTTANYAFETSCDTPLQPCAYGLKDPEHCPSQPMCRCFAHGNCKVAFDPTQEFYCSCVAGFSGAKCDQCKAGHYGPSCRKCECDANHGACEDGISGSGACKCHKTFIGKTCSVSVIGMAFGLIFAVGLAAGFAVLLRTRVLKKRSESLIGEPLNEVK